VRTIPLSALVAPDCHPFRVVDDEQMTRLVESVKQFGVREPGLARPRGDGLYELIAGNRRKRACELAGLDAMPVIVRNLDDAAAVLAMVDSNLQQRETILPSERAFAYKMKMEALNHNGVKADKHSCQVMAEQTGESAAQIFRFIRLTELVEILLDKVDAKLLAMTPAVEILHLSYDEQHAVAACMAKLDMRPSLAQAVALRKAKKDGTLTGAEIERVLSAVKEPTKPQKSPQPQESLEPQKGTEIGNYKRFFPAGYTDSQMESVIVALLEKWAAVEKTA